jgi:hypothetical protein
VLTLYGNELAINHLILSEKINIGLADKLLDQVTTDQDQYDRDTTLPRMTFPRRHIRADTSAHDTFAHHISARDTCAQCI